MTKTKSAALAMLAYKGIAMCKKYLAPAEDSTMSVEKLTTLQYSKDRKGPWKLYVYEPNSEFHRGGVWFMEKPKYPEEGEITTAAAKLLTITAMEAGREVRICDGGDMLVFHVKGRVILYGDEFLKEVFA